ncbi:NAD-dependent epimerase/dehydratase family protein [Salinibacterium sp. CAN_S4]|uniref:NAD-dependent epimerase/dehydratase family protein n=1 Tax=Salinibacterium sp. CAN_S4 TaxID=2787727 RepID=UPI0018EFE8B7
MDIGTVLVTGGAGFIGTALASKLAGRADRWVVLDSLHPQVHKDSLPPSNLHDRAELVVGDVTDGAVWDSLLSDIRPEVVIHLAAETGTAQSLDEASRHSRVNVVGTTEMIDAFGRAGHLPAHVLLSSSRAVYGEGDWKRADGSTFQPGQRSHAQLEASQWDFEDSTPVPSSAKSTVPAPTSVYGATKLAQENILSAWGGSRGVDITKLRLQNVYGPGQSLINSYTGIVSLFSQWARDGLSIPLYEDGLIGRDFVYIEDVADAFVAAILAGPDARRPTLDIGTGVAHTIADMAIAIANYYGAPAPVVNGKYRDGDVRAASCDISLTLDLLDWSPQWSLDRGAAALQKWIAAELTRA